MSNQSALTPELAMSLASTWYSEEGPFKGQYTMVPIKAFKNADLAYSIRFKIQPDLGGSYFRQFEFAKNHAGNPYVTGWNSRPELPFDAIPTESDEEALDAADDAADADDDDGDDDLGTLEDEADMDIDALRAMYGGPAAQATTTAVGDGEVEAEAPPPGPPDPCHPADQPLTEAIVKQLAAHWYSSYGPFRHLYTMDPLRAYRNTEAEWSVRFKVIKDTGTIYFRRFVFNSSEETNCWQVKEWSENPELPPGLDYVPDELGLAEQLNQLSDDNDDNTEASDGEDNLDLLQQDADMSVDDLRRMYGYSEANADVMAVISPQEHRTRKRRKSEEESDPVGSLSAGETSAKRPKEAGSLDNDDKDDNADNDDSDDDFDTGVEGTLHLQHYFQEAMHEVDLDTVVGLTHKEIPIGDNHQAIVPALDPDNSVDQRFLSSQLQWTPPQGSAGNSSFEQELDLYLAPALAAREQRDARLETALQHLFKHGFDIEQATKTLNVALIEALPAKFTAEEIDAFQQGLVRYGKQFSRIQETFLPFRSPRELVKLYYDWKHSPAYLAWVKQGHGFQDKSRRKHVFAPGNDITTAPYDFVGEPMVLAPAAPPARYAFLTSPRRHNPVVTEHASVPET
eukprot:m.109631 g.109631  ORF g.109631 m.109631 type:complete len:625 (+) comp15349_c0_seq3:93-1967(+)